MSSSTKKLFKDRITKRDKAVLAQELLDAINQGNDAVKNLHLEAQNWSYTRTMAHTERGCIIIAKG